MELMAEGTYEGVTKSAVLYESKGNALMCVFDVEVEHRILKAWITLVQKDGTVSERGLQNVQEIMGWTGWDWAAFDADPSTFGGRPVSAVIETAQDTKGNPESKIKWLNAPGTGVQRADAKTMAAKYGAKFRALTGGTPPAAKPAAPAMEQPNLPRRQEPPSQPKPATSTQEACWEKLCDLMAGKPQDVIGSAWFRLVDRVSGGKDQTDLSAIEWGEAMALICSAKPAAPAPAAPPPPAKDDDNLPF